MKIKVIKNAQVRLDVSIELLVNHYCYGYVVKPYTIIIELPNGKKEEIYIKKKR